ncbi:MAG: hypothetical protein KTR32_38300 [Granulosicoccus sp.]|nr:hypothetical protein [Granulosicoccus sp.]
MINCPVCGGAVRRLTPLRRSRTCPYCGHDVHFHNSSAIDSDSDTSGLSLLSAPSFFVAGHGIKLDGIPYQIAGSIRLVNAESWRSVERWWVRPLPCSNAQKDNGCWISFDGESHRLLSSLPLEFSAQSVQCMKVSEVITDSFGLSWLVIERRDITVENISGELPANLFECTSGLRIDAVGGGRHIVIELFNNAVRVLLSEPLNAKRLQQDHTPAAFDQSSIESVRDFEPAQFLSKISTASSLPESAVEQSRDRDVSVFACGECGGLLESYFRASLRIVCKACGASTDIKGATKDPILNAAARAFDHSLATRRAEFGLGSRIRHAYMSWRVIGVQQFTGTLSHREFPVMVVDKSSHDFRSSYTLWWLLNERREIAWIGERDGSRFWIDPVVPDDATLPEAPSKNFYSGEWTLVDAVGEFPYRIEVGEHHRTIDGTASKARMTIELFLDKNDKPWRIQHSVTTPLDDLEVLAAIDDSDNAAKIKRLRKIKRISLMFSILPLLALLYTWLAQVDVRIFHPIVLVFGSFLCLVISNACEIAACRIGHKHAFLTLGSRTDDESR